MASSLFEVPIGNAGKITVTEPAAKVYLVTFASPPDNRLTTVSLQETELVELPRSRSNTPSGLL